jgi:hypothetical protein
MNKLNENEQAGNFPAGFPSRIDPKRNDDYTSEMFVANLWVARGNP